VLIYNLYVEENLDQSVDNISLPEEVGTKVVAYADDVVILLMETAVSSQGGRLTVDWELTQKRPN